MNTYDKVTLGWGRTNKKDQKKQSLKFRYIALTLYASNFDLTVSHRKISSIVTCDAHIAL